MAQLIGKYYTWGTVTIYFDSNGILCTPWTMGTYEWLDKKTVRASWAGFSHTLIFNPTYTQFTSVRDGDQVKGTHDLVEHAKGSMIPSIYIDYKASVSELCILGKKYNVDKSSQRENPGSDDSHHCHPYSLFYHALFKESRHRNMNFCEIGIAEGRSLLMWEEYFPNANIYGFEKWQRWLDNWSTHYSDRTRIHVASMDVRINSEITGPLQKTGAQFDCIIDDSSHMFYDMIRIIKCALPFVKPGGLIIIEDIRIPFDEAWFYNELKDVLGEFQTVYFAELNHNRKNSGCVKNDKVLVLVKKGPKLFQNTFF